MLVILVTVPTATQNSLHPLSTSSIISLPSSGYYNAGKDNRGRCTNNLSGRHPIRTIGAPTSIIPPLYILTQAENKLKYSLCCKSKTSWRNHTCTHTHTHSHHKKLHCVLGKNSTFSFLNNSVKNITDFNDFWYVKTWENLACKSYRFVHLTCQI